MDIFTVIGMVLGPACILVSIVLSGAPITAFIDPPSVFIVVGGSAAALLVSYPQASFMAGLKSIGKAFKKNSANPEEIIKQMNEIALIARKDGLLALEEKAQKIEDEFLKKALMLVVDGTEPDLVRSILETELIFVETRHKDNQGFWTAVADMGPAWGMIGTLVGLVAMLGALDDPSAIGPKMAVSLLTTMYGSIIANQVGGPVAAKLKANTAEEIAMKQLMIEGLLSVQAGENARVIEEKLKAFLSPKTREILGTGEGA